LTEPTSAQKTARSRIGEAFHALAGSPEYSVLTGH